MGFTWRLSDCEELVGGYLEGSLSREELSGGVFSQGMIAVGS